MAQPPSAATDLLDFVNRLDRAWHGQSVTYEREALTRLVQMLTLPARLVDPARPAAIVKRATVLRNVRFTGTSVHEFFFEDQTYTEVDGLLIGLGSALGHPARPSIYVVEVERKARDRNADYLRAMQRARKICALLHTRFQVDAWPVLVYDDRRGRLSYARYEGDLVAIPMSHLRAVTGGLPIVDPDAIPGRRGDRTLTKLDLLWQLARSNPDDPWSAPRTAAGLAEGVGRAGLDLRLPVTGHQDLGRAPPRLDRWLEDAREGPGHLEERVGRYLDELADAGQVRRVHDRFALTPAGGDTVLAYSRFRDEGGP